MSFIKLVDEKGNEVLCVIPQGHFSYGIADITDRKNSLSVHNRMNLLLTQIAHQMQDPDYQEKISKRLRKEYSE